MNTGPSVEVGPVGPGICQSTSWDLLLPPDGRLLGWEGQGVIYFYRVPISYRDLPLTNSACFVFCVVFVGLVGPDSSFGVPGGLDNRSSCKPRVLLR